MPSYLGRNLIEALIKGDTFDGRFERFVAALMSTRDGEVYTTTSPTGDLGRDAYAKFERIDGVAMVCATTQSQKIKEKLKADIDRLANGAMHIGRLHLCSSKELSEKTRDEIRQYALGKFPKRDIQVHGATQIVDLAHRYQAPLLDHYGRDLDVLEIADRRRRDEDDEQENPVHLLRVALATVFDPNVIAQRDHILATLVLTAIEDADRPMNAQHLCRAISKALRLTDAPVVIYLTATLHRLAENRLIALMASGWALTDAGRNEVARLTHMAANRVLHGRAAFLKLLGKLEPDLADARALTHLWHVIQQHIAEMFLNSGLRLVDDIRVMADSSTMSRPSPNSLQSLHTLLERIKEPSLPQKLSERAQAVVIDILTNPGSEAFVWISELAAKYLVICALGLDPELERRIADRVSYWHVVPDTHVVLAYLSAGDDRHEQAEQLLGALRRLNASLMFADSVLEEAVHHAELAVDQFGKFSLRVQENQREWPEAIADDVVDHFDNAFIKGFARESGSRFLPSDWSGYIAQFICRGVNRTASLRALLTREFPGAELTTDDAHVKLIGRVFADTKTANYEESDGERKTLRLQWDGRLMAMCTFRRKEIPFDRRLIVLTDSEELRNSFVRSVEAGKRAGITLTRPASMAAALMLVPNTSVNLECVRLLLFDDLRIAMNAVERAVFRSTGERFLRRHGLEQRIDDALLDATS